MSAAYWIGNNLFLGKIIIGKVAEDWTPGPNGETCAGLSYLPGAGIVIGTFSDEAKAREMVMQSAQSRVKAMFGAGMETTVNAVHEGRSLRVTARAIWRAGVWRCDQPVNAHQMFEDLGKALNLKPEDAPKQNRRPGDVGEQGSSAEPLPEPEDLVESA